MTTIINEKKGNIYEKTEKGKLRNAKCKMQK